MANKITYDIGFNVNNSGLQQVRTELQNIGSMTLKDLKLIDATATKTELNEIKESAHAVGAAIEASFNPKLGTINVDKFNSSLKGSGQTVAQIEANFAKMGSAGKTAFRNLTSEILTTKREVKQTSNFLDSMARTLGNTIKWSIASSAINMVTGEIKKAWGYTKKLDESLNDIRIVTGRSSDEMDRFAKQANRAAKSLGAATTDYTNASLIYYQQGLSDSDVKARTEATIKAANVTGQSAAEVSEQLTAVWNGYKVVAEEAEMYVDKLAAVAATTAADLEELSTGMSKVASAANAMGVNIDQLSAQLSTIVSVTRQDASLVGTALKTIYARMGDLKVDGIDEFGTSLGDVSTQMQQMGIAVLDQEGNLRDMGAVIEDVAAKWGTWTDAQQQAAAVAIAGKRQYNNLIALFENWDMYESALSTSETSAGTLQKQQDTYMDSLEAHLEQLSTAGQRVYDAFFDTDSMKDLIDVLTVVVDTFAGFVESIGGGGNLLLGFGSTALRVFSGQIAGGISRLITNLGIMRESIIQNRAELEIQSEYENASDTAVQKMVEIKKQELKYGKLLTEEEKEKFDFYIKQTAELQNQLEEQEKLKKEAEDYYKSRFGVDVDADAKASSKNGVTSKKAAEDLETEANELDAEANDSYRQKLFKDASYSERVIDIEEGSYSHLKDMNREDLLARQNQLESLKTKAADSGDTDIEDQYQDEISAIQTLLEYKEKLRVANKNLNKSVQSLIDSEKLNKEQVGELIAAKKAYNKGQISAVEYEKKVKQALQGTAKAHRNTAEQIKKGNKPVAEAKKKVDALSNSYKGFQKTVQMTAALKGVITMIGAIGQLSSAIQTLINIKDILNDKDLAPWEKFLQVVSAGATGITMLAFAMGGLKKGLVESGIAAAFNNSAMGRSIAVLNAVRAAKAANNEETSEAIAKTLAEKYAIDLTSDEYASLSGNALFAAVAQKIMGKSAEGTVPSFSAMGTAAWASLGPYTILIAVVIALIAALIAIICIFGKEAPPATEAAGKALDAARESAKKAQEAFAAAKDEYADLVDKIADYKDAKTALDELRVGTDEWKEAVAQLNTQVLDLVAQYPTLLDFMEQDEYGVLSISQEGFDKVVEEKQQAVKDASASATFSKIAVKAAEKDYKEADMKDHGYNSTKETDAVKNIVKQYREDSSIFAEGRKEEGGIDFESIAKQYWEASKDTVYYSDGGRYETDAGVIRDKTQIKDANISDEMLQAITAGVVDGTTDLTLAYSSADKLAEALEENYNTLEENTKALANNAKETAALEAVYLRQLAEAQGIEDSNTYANLALTMEDLGSSYDDMLAEAGDEYWDTYLSDYAGSDQTNDDAALDDSVKQSVKDIYGEDAVVTGLDDVDWSEVESLDSFKDIEFEVNGTAMTGADLVAKHGEQYVQDYIINANKELENQIAEYSKAGIDTRAAYFMQGENFKYDQNKADKANLSMADLEGMQNVITDEAVLANIEAYQQSFEQRRAEVFDGLSQLTSLSGTETGFANFSLDDFQTMQNNMLKAQAAGGGEAVASLYEKYATDAEALEFINEKMTAVNWSDTASIGAFIEQLSEQGIIIDENSVAWNSFMEEVYDGTKQWVQNSKQVIANLATIKDLTGDIHVGDILSDEDYKRLLAISPEIASMFIKTADGYKALANSKELDKVLKKQYQGLSELKAFYGEVSSELELSGVKGSASLDFNKSGDVVDFMSTFAASENIHNYDEIFDYAGTSKAAIAAAYEYVNTEGVDTTSSEYIEYLNLLKETANKINQAALDKENGLLNSRQGQEIWATEIAGSWSEVAAADLNEDIKAKAEKMWSDTYLTEMGFSGLTSFNLGASELEEHLENIRKLELDYYQDINNALDILGGKIERAFGADKIALLEEQSALYEENLSRANEQAAAAQNTFDSMFASFLSGAYEAYGVTGADLMTEDGELDLVAMRDLQATLSPDSDEYKDIDNIISMWSSVEDAASTASEAAWSLIDAEVEAFRYQAELQSQLNETAKQWLEFGRKFEGYASGDLDVFGEQSAADMINDAFEDYAQERSALGNWFGQLDSLSGVMDNYNENIDEYNARAAETATANASYLAAKQELINAQDNYGILKETLDTATSLKEDAEDAIEARDNAAANAAKQKAEMDAAQSDYDSKSAAYDSAIAARQSQDAELAAKQAALDSAQAAYDSALATKNAAQATADKASKKEKDAANAALNLANDGLTKAQAALTEAQNAQATAKTNQENALAAEEAARQAKADADATLKRETSEYNSTQEAANEATEKANEAIRQYAESLGVTYTEGMTVQDLEDELAALESSVSDAEAAVTAAQGEFQDAQEALTSAESAQRAVAERIAENNPYATVGEHGELIWDESAFNEDWETYLSEAQESLEEMQGQLQNLYEGYLQAQEELMAIYDDEISKLSTINSILQSSADLWKMVGKNVSGFSSQLTSYYKSITDNTAQAYQLANVKLEIAQEEYEKVMALGENASDEMIQTVTDNLAAASESVVSSASEWMTAIADEFSVTMNAAIDDFMKQATGMDLASITESWELATQQDERYLDDVNAGYSIDNVERTFQKSIDATDSITAQKKLNSVMQEQLKMLREKDKLSQYDIDRANAMYELTLKQIALEEAQQTANKMKLSRDASGNYTYQYVADQDSIAKAEEELAAAENNLYNMDKDRTKSLVDDYYSTMTEANEAIAAAMAEGDTERVERLKDYYFGANGLLSGVQSELRAAQINLNAIGTDLMGSGWTSSLESFTSAIVDSDLGSLAETVGGIVDETSTTLEGVTATITSMLSEGSFLSESVNALNNSLKSAGELEAETRELMVATHNVLTELPILTTEIDTLVTQLEGYGEKYQEWLESKIDETETAANTLATESNTEALRDLTNVIKGESNSSGGEGSTGGAGGSGLSQVGGTGVNRNTVSTRTDV
jgi:TP901 family phage tail tape measure protein